jgi:acylphosphatase
VHRLHPATNEIVDFLRTLLLRAKRSRALTGFIEVKDLGLVEGVVVEAIAEAVADFLQTLTELMSPPSMEL